MTMALLAPGSPSRPVVLSIGGTTIVAGLLGAAFGGTRVGMTAAAVVFGVGNLVGALQYLGEAKNRRDCEVDPDCSSAPDLGTSETMQNYAVGAGILGVGGSALGIYLWRSRR